MSTYTYETADEVSAVVAALGPDNRLKVFATHLEDGTYELAVPDDLDVILEGLDIADAHLSVLKQSLPIRIDAMAEIERLKYITNGVGQAMTYQQKSTEAIVYLAASNPVESDYPLLSAEVGTTGETLGEVATVIKTAFEQWQQIGAAIEKVRLSAKKAIREAETAEAAQAVFDAMVWPTV